MARRPETRPTLIYWLIDMRPETIAAGWHSGYPFYCGKTVVLPIRRLVQHRHTAVEYPRRQLSVAIRECGEHVRVQTMEVISPEIDWRARERYWIELLKFSFPERNANVSKGGDGCPGFVHRPESIAKMRGRKVSSETRVKMGAWQKGRQPSVATLEKMKAARKGRKLSVAHRANLSVAGAKRKWSAETCAKISAAKRGKQFSAEHLASLRTARQGRKLSAEHRANIGLALRARRASAES